MSRAPQVCDVSVGQPCTPGPRLSRFGVFDGHGLHVFPLSNTEAKRSAKMKHYGFSGEAVHPATGTSRSGFSHRPQTKRNKAYMVELYVVRTDEHLLYRTIATYAKRHDNRRTRRTSHSTDATLHGPMRHKHNPHKAQSSRDREPT
eukprot:1842516-Prymnesium_polylepis.1